ncbi:beta-lactamase family protein [Metarhizium album ARSEF 1941]|uniref:Actin-like protein ARP6 n=1 Tax=Metarhizium album (strain ARSEF 1941) TaxID=1081103 RepID=A0A0B2X5B1_METAS|nr:beta-lactamase family protein [Metarhizium album ARSEF 1941]KHO01564.1 beta-lactamase family protein [Metarhizium album ARSEF 1941]
MNVYARLYVLLMSLAGPTSAALNCRPEGRVLPKPNLSDSPIVKSAGASLAKTLNDAVRGVVKAGWPVENVSFSLAVVSTDQKSAGVPVWEYHHRAEKNNRGTKNVTRDSQYLIGSVSKVISDYILLKAGVDLDRPVTDFIPELNSSRSKTHWKHVTLRMLGSQLSGAPTNNGFSEYYYLRERFVQSGFPPLKDSDYPSCGVIGLNKGCSVNELLDGMTSQYPVTAPMERPAYSNVAFAIFVLALQEAIGKNYTDLVADIVTKPLGMRNTLPSPGDDDQAVIPPGDSSWGVDYAYNAPGGGLVSSVADLSRFTYALLTRTLDPTPSQTRQWLKPADWTGAYSAVGMPWEFFRPLNLTPAHPHPVVVAGKGGAAQLYSSQLNVVDEYGMGLIMLSAGNTGASTVLSDALLAIFVPAADEASRDQAEKQYARTFKSDGTIPQSKAVKAAFLLDDDSLVVSEIRHGGKDIVAGIKKIWGLAVGQYAAAFGSTMRLFPTDLSQTAQMDGNNVTAEVWRMWPEFGEPIPSDMPGFNLGYENCLQWTLGDWIHYGKEPLDRVVFYKDSRQDVVGFEMPFLRSGILRPRYFRQTQLGARTPSHNTTSAATHWHPGFMAGGRKAKPTLPARPTNTLIVDNGAYTFKAGIVANGHVSEPRVVPNCIARDRSRKVYLGSEIAKCRDFGELQFRRPVERGFIVNWEAQKEIWDQEIFDNAATKCDPAETRLILSEPPNGLPALQTNCDQVVFEEYGFASYYRGINSTFNAYHDVQNLFRTPKETPTAANVPAEVMLVVDSGYSHTTVSPLLRGQPLHSAVRRLDVGGKLLTNYLARLLSLRHFDMRNETCIVNEMKEAACYVTLDFKSDLEKTWKGTRGEKRPSYVSGAGIVKDYVLPDFHTRTRGSMRDYDPTRHTRARKLAAAGQTDEDVLTLRNERFAVPELIFNPLDMGMRQPGLADLIQQSIQQLPLGLWPGLLANIVVVGGNTLFDGFIQRLQKEVVQRVPDDCVVRVARPADPITSTWFGAANLASHPNIEKLVVTKKEYEELGSSLVARKFAAGLNFT